MCTTEENMAEAEESDAIGLSIALEFSIKTQEQVVASSKLNQYRSTPHMYMTTDTTATSTSTEQEVTTHGVHAYYKDDE